MLAILKEVLQNPAVCIIIGIDAALLLLILINLVWVFVLWMLDKPWRRWFYKPQRSTGNATQIFRIPVQIRLHPE